LFFKKKKKGRRKLAEISNTVSFFEKVVFVIHLGIVSKID